MEILRAFIPDIGISINVQGTPEAPLFQASQIGELLGLSNIRDAIKHFDDDEKALVETNTPGGQQSVLFLTEMGLYRLLGESQEPWGLSFQKWVGSVVTDIHRTGKYELESQITLASEPYSASVRVTEQMKVAHEEYKIKVMEDQVEKSRKKVNYAMGDTVYIVMERWGDNNTVFKVGSSDNMNEQEESYYRHSINCFIVYTKMCQNRKVLEDAMHLRFNEFQYNGREDWFLASFEALRDALDTLQLDMDGEASAFTIDARFARVGDDSSVSMAGVAGHT